MYWHRLHGCYGRVFVCPKSIIQLQQRHVTDLLLSATWTGNIDRQQRALSNNHDTAELTKLKIELLSDEFGGIYRVFFAVEYHCNILRSVAFSRANYKDSFKEQVLFSNHKM